jgi:hypothetical protein
MLIDFARVDEVTRTDEIEHELCPLFARGRPGREALTHAVFRTRMHQRLNGSGYEAVVDEEIFFDVELRVVAFKVAGTVVLHAMAEDQILRAGWRADWVGLHETELLQRSFQRGRREQALVYGETAQVVERDSHDSSVIVVIKAKPRYTMRREPSCESADPPHARQASG